MIGHAADWVERYSAAAAALVVTATVWSVLHPPSYHLLRCIAAAMPVWAGYAQTARACAIGNVPDGAPVRVHASPTFTLVEASYSPGVCRALRMQLICLM